MYIDRAAVVGQRWPFATPWAKLSPSPSGWLWLPLLEHCLDVGVVFRGIVSQPVIRDRIDVAAGAHLTDGDLDRLAVIMGAHDMGKANTAFQDKPFTRERISHTTELLGIFLDDSLRLRFLSEIDAEGVGAWFQGGGSTLEEYLGMLMGHHGRPIDTNDQHFFPPTSTMWFPNHGRDPILAIGELMRGLKLALIEHQDFTAIPKSPSLQHYLYGLLMVSDWIASDESRFPIDRDNDFDRKVVSQRFLTDIGLLNPAAVVTTLASGVTKLGLPRLNSIQSAMTELDPDGDDAHLVTIESETGSGKTEAALLWWMSLRAAGKVDGFYFALPTRVSAKQIHDRLQQYSDHAWNGTPIAKAWPAAAKTIDGDTPTGTKLSSFNYLDEAIEPRWAERNSKRFLASFLAVGTIDQALAAILKAKHSHLRGSLLRRSLLIVDEVHASDVYMGELLRDLLRAHIRGGGYALLLSATLGSSLRDELMSDVSGAISSPSLEEAIRVPYPTIVSRVFVPLSSERSKSVSMQLMHCAETPDDTLAAPILHVLQHGGRVLVVANTVKRAVGLQQWVEGIAPSGSLFTINSIPAPHHSRFAGPDREMLDARVIQLLGKDAPDGGVVVVGTQTLEQSLDIDCDLLITDLCPADILLQRLGRLHRHERPRLSDGVARCIVLGPSGDLVGYLNSKGDTLPMARSRGWGQNSVYENLAAVELTRRLICDHSEWKIPADNRMLVESSTHRDAILGLCESDVRWRLAGWALDSAISVQSRMAQSASMSGWLSQPFGNFTLEVGSDLECMFKTRIGADSLRLPTQSFVSPFGNVIDELTVPMHIIDMTKEGLDDSGGFVVTDVATRDSRGLTIFLRLGDQRLRYSRFGIERDV
jgi:CRISPR-associated endonuclease/helicase Cas3